MLGQIDKKTEYMDNADRVAVEWAFALAKSKYGLGLITSKLNQTTRSSIVLSVVAMNVDRIYRSLCASLSISYYQGTNPMNLC